MNASAVILAAGRGDRMQAGSNKLLLPIGEQPLLCWTIRAFAQLSEIDDLIVVVHASEKEAIKLLIHSIAPNARIVEGGPTRRDSALAGVRAAHRDIVLIHDGARPFPTNKLILSVIAKARQEKAAIPILPVTDLLHHLEPGGTITALPNLDKQLARAQTPQGFQRDLILRCLEDAPPSIRDDASAVLWAGKAVSTVSGESANIKITQPEDLALAKAIAAFLES